MQNFGSYKLIHFSPKADGLHLVTPLKKEKNKSIYKLQPWSIEDKNIAYRTNICDCD
jgi:hypothetical protein